MCAHLFQAARHDAFDGAIGAHRHEDRGLYNAVVQRKLAAAGMAVCGLEFKLEHAAILEGACHSAEVQLIQRTVSTTTAVVSAEDSELAQASAPNTPKPSATPQAKTMRPMSW